MGISDFCLTSDAAVLSGWWVDLVQNQIAFGRWLDICPLVVCLPLFFLAVLYLWLVRRLSHLFAVGLKNAARRDLGWLTTRLPAPLKTFFPPVSGSYSARHPQKTIQQISQCTDIPFLISLLAVDRPITLADSSVVASLVVDRLGELRAAASVEPLIEVLKWDDAWLAAKAVKALGQIGDPRAIDALIAALHSTDRRQALQEWTEHHTQARAEHPDARRDFWTAAGIVEFEEEISNLRRASALALSQIGDEHAVPALLLTVQDTTDGTVQAAAFEALARLRAARAVPVLVQLLNNKTLIDVTSPRPTCDFAASTLEAIGTPEAVAAVQTWRTLAP